MKCQITLRHSKCKEILLDGVWRKVNEPLDVSLTQALRYGRFMPTDVVYYDQRVPYNPDQYRKNKIFGLTGNADTSSGFGNCTVNLIKYSLSNGYDVRWVGLNSNVKELNPIMSKEIPEDIAMIYHEQPPDSWLTSPFQKKICILPFETTRIPDSWINKVNSMDACLVPCKQNEQMMRDSGINVPISIIKWGVDENLFSYIDRPDDGIFTFGQCGALSERKGTDLLVKAFIKAFPPQEGAKVRLLLKTSHNVFTFGVKGERRIQVIMLPLDHDEFLRQFWNKVDCFVFPTRGEGAGLPPLEAMATGLPVIVTNWSGPADYINSDIGFPLNNYKMVPAEAFSKKLYKEDCGNWAEPDLDELVNTMRYAYYHQDECKEKGKKAAEYIKQNWLWKDTIHTFHDALDKYL